MMSTKSGRPRAWSAAGSCGQKHSKRRPSLLQCVSSELALNSLSELPLVGLLSGAKQTPLWQLPETGFGPKQLKSSPKGLRQQGGDLSSASGTTARDERDGE
jgi:hypothetical protein